MELKRNKEEVAAEVGKYLNCELAYQCYQELTTSNLGQLWTPTEYFELFHEAYALIITYRDNPILAKQKLDERLASYSEDQQGYLYINLEEKLDKDLTSLFILNNEKLKLCHALILKEIDKRWPLTEDEEETEDKFKWANIKRHVDLLTDPNSQISYLINTSAEYKQHVICNGLSSNGITEMCQIEMDRIKQQQELEAMKKPYAGNIYLSADKGKKINFIRVINALYELRFFQDDQGQIPTKETVMITIGKALGIDLSSYDADLSQAFNTGNADKNTTIFRQMIEKTEDQVLTRNVTKKQY
jgi:hypothetical protein